MKFEVRNKANLGQLGWHPGSDYAKQSQFLDFGLRIVDFGLRKTNPILGGVGQPSLAPRPSGPAPGPEAAVQTKPIERSLKFEV